VTGKIDPDVLRETIEKTRHADIFELGEDELYVWWD